MINCRMCGATTKRILSLGQHYPNGFYKSTVGSPAELTLCGCTKCGLVQIEDHPPLDSMYRQYWYRSGINQAMRDELLDIVRSVSSWVSLSANDVVLDIGSNDGTLLSLYPKELFRVGIDPATNLAKEAEAHASVIVPDYFTAKNYHAVAKAKAKVITSIAMFYDLPDPNAFVDDISECLDDQGIWILQLSYTPLMLKQLAFDNVCYEHVEYYFLRDVDRLCRAHGLKILDAFLNDANGGSVRVYVAKDGYHVENAKSLHFADVGRMRAEALLDMESKLPDDLWSNFRSEIESLKKKTTRYLRDAVSAGKSVWGYGASTKGNTLLQYYGLGPDVITAIAERNPEKWGLKTNGTEIPIVSEEEMRRAAPDLLLVLPWTFSFAEREKAYLDGGGALLIPLPKLYVITSRGKQVV
jgi:NDP-4-keto-2,6-dideoxyhexose 3-C-methyltransferase